MHIAYSTGRSLLIISHVVSDKVNRSFLGVWGQVFSDAIAIVSIIVSYNSCYETRVCFVLQKELPLFRETTPFYALFAHFRASALSVSIFAPLYMLLVLVVVVCVSIGAGIGGYLVGFYPVESAITAGLRTTNMGGTGDIAVLSAAKRMELLPLPRSQRASVVR